MCWRMGLAIGETVVEAMSGFQSASDSEEYADANTRAAYSDAVDKWAAEHLASIQEDAKATNENLALRTSAIEAAGTAKASALNGGRSTETVVRDAERQRATQSNVIETNLKNAHIQADYKDKAIAAEAQSRANSVVPTASPNLIATAISGLGNVGSAYTTTRDYGEIFTGKKAPAPKKEG